jgi:hypothetical protein
MYIASYSLLQRSHIFAAGGVCKMPASVLLQFAALVKKYQPHFYVNGHDHVMCYFNAKMYGYSTQFFTSGMSDSRAICSGVNAVASVPCPRHQNLAYHLVFVKHAQLSKPVCSAP